MTKTSEKKSWILNAFAMFSPGHLSPGKTYYMLDISHLPRIRQRRAISCRALTKCLYRAMEESARSRR